MISISKALDIIKCEIRRLPAETIRLQTAVGRILAEEIRADMSLPPFNRSQMDGFAVRTIDTAELPARLKIVGEAVAGKSFDGEVGAGEAVRIMTGAPVPAGADAVQKVELTAESDNFVVVRESVKRHQNINLHASEIVAGELIFAAGETITANMIAAIASFGYAEVKVYVQPKIGILSTGNEIVEIAATPQKDQIRNSNSMMLNVFAAPIAAVEILPLVGDDVANLREAIERATGEYDVLITTGGVSVGDYDFTKPVLRELGAEIFFEKVSLKPGKPTVFARRGECLIFGLPGNPVSSAVTFHLFVRTAILLMQSSAAPELRRGFAVAGGKIKAAGERDSVLPVSLSTDARGRLLIETVRFSGSSNFIAFARSNAFVLVAQGVNLDKGDVAEIYYAE